MTVTAMQAHAFVRRVDSLAADVGTLRRRLADDGNLWLVERIASHVEMIDSFIQPTGAEIYAANFAFCCDEQESAAAAVEDIDGWTRHFRGLLGEPTDDLFARGAALERSNSSRRREDSILPNNRPDVGPIRSHDPLHIPELGKIR